MSSVNTLGHAHRGIAYILLRFVKVLLELLMKLTVVFAAGHAEVINPVELPL